MTKGSKYSRTLTACYLAASLSKSPVVCLIGCIICGFSVGIMWPGIVGFFAQINNDDLKSGMLAGAVFPLVLVISVAGILIKVRKERKNKG